MNSWVETTKCPTGTIIIGDVERGTSCFVTLSSMLLIFGQDTVLAFDSAHMMHLDEIFCLDIIFLYCSK